MKSVVITAFLLSFFFFLPQVSAVIPPLTQPEPQSIIPNWGFIIYQDIDAYQYNSGYYDTDWNAYPDTPLSTNFYIFCFGRHEIRCEFHFDVFTYDWSTGPTVNFSKIVHWTYTGIYKEKLYLFNFLMRPHVHLRTPKVIAQGPFPVMINGTLHSQLFIDNQLVWQETVTVTNPHYENPYVCNERPIDGLSITELQPRCSIGVTYVNFPPNNMSEEFGKTFDVFWYENSTGPWVLRQVDRNVESKGFDAACGWDFTQANQYDKKYWWKVSVDDGEKNVTRIYDFTTRRKSFWEYPIGFPSDNLYIRNLYGTPLERVENYGHSMKKTFYR